MLEMVARASFVRPEYSIVKRGDDTRVQRCAVPRALQPCKVSFGWRKVLKPGSRRVEPCCYRTFRSDMDGGSCGSRNSNFFHAPRLLFSIERPKV